MLSSRRALSVINSSSQPENAVTIHTETPFMKFQTVQEYETRISFISQEEYDQGELPELMHQMCLSCVTTPIDVSSCRLVNNRWGMAWKCYNCGGFLKQSKEMITWFLRGAEKLDTLKQEEICKYGERRFPWVEDAKSDTGIHQIFMQTACAAKRGGMCLREAFGGADFVSYHGIFSILARSWCEQRDWTFHAIRIQGIILLRHAKSHTNYHHNRDNVKEARRDNMQSASKMRSEMKVHRFHLVKSALRSNDGSEHSLSVLTEYRLTADGKPIVHTEPCLTKQSAAQPSNFANGLMLRAMSMALTGIPLVQHNYTDNKSARYSYEQVRENPDLPRLEQHSWSCLSNALAQIKECLPRDGEYCTISIDQNKQSGDVRRVMSGEGAMNVENKGKIDLSCLRDDFRDAFGIN